MIIIPLKNEQGQNTIMTCSYRIIVMEAARSCLLQFSLLLIIDKCQIYLFMMLLGENKQIHTTSSSQFVRIKYQILNNISARVLTKMKG